MKITKGFKHTKYTLLNKRGLVWKPPEIILKPKYLLCLLYHCRLQLSSLHPGPLKEREKEEGEKAQVYTELTPFKEISQLSHTIILSSHWPELSVNVTVIAKEALKCSVSAGHIMFCNKIEVLLLKERGYLLLGQCLAVSALVTKWGSKQM